MYQNDTKQFSFAYKCIIMQQHEAYKVENKKSALAGYTILSASDYAGEVIVEDNIVCG